MVTRGNTITITVTLLQNGSYGIPLPDQRIFFFDQTYDTYIGFDKTDRNGIASIEWNIPLDHALGSTTINATFYGNESLSLAPSSVWTVLIILSSTNIEVNQISDVLAPEDTLSFFVHITDDANIPLSNATIKVLKDNIQLATRTTNMSGYIHFEIKCNSTWITLGTNEIHVIYEQDLHHFLESSEIIFVVNISKIATTVSLQTPYPNEVKLNEFVTLYAELSQSNGSLPHEPLKVFLDDSFLFLTTTNSSGIAPIDFNIDERFTLGFHRLKIQYNGSNRFTESYFELLFSVRSPVQIIIDIPEFVDIGSNVEITIDISDSLGRVISDSLISIFDSTSNQQFTQPSNSIETTTNFQYELQGPPGTHTLIIEIKDNPFIMNARSISNFSAWSIPNIKLLDCNIDQYASPSQEVFFEIHMTDWAGNCSFRLLHLLIENEYQDSMLTNNNGLGTFTFSVPYIENQYNISIFYSGNISLYESSTKYDYSLQVTSLMPVRLELDFYEVVIPLRELSVFLKIEGYNGTLLQGVKVNFNWLDSYFDTKSMEDGIIILHLKVPTIGGYYVLSYESETSSSVLSTSGSFIIEIQASDLMSLEGVGITGLVIILIVSIGISIVPIIHRKYLIS
ncbi:MAG: hypothetical protein ACFFDQ_00125 [Candidatus Thorarchaeota archaeon]